MTPHAIREVVVGGEPVLRDDELLRVGWDDVLGGLRDITKDWPVPRS
jgi:hypothetical protein